MSWVISPGGKHPEALDWQTRVVSNGGTVSQSTLYAVSDFCVRVDQEPGLRSAITRLNLFCGDNLNAALVPLFLAESLGATAKGNLTDTNPSNVFASGDYTETGTNGGLKGNGTSKYLDTGLQQSVFGSATSLHLSVSGKEMSNGTTDRTFLGSYGANLIQGSLHSLDEVANYVGTNSRSYRAGTYTAGQFPSTTKTTSEDHLLGTLTSSTSATLYRNGTSVATNNTTVNPTRPAHKIYVFCLNQHSSGAVGGFSAARLRMYSIGSGITSAQALAFSSAVSAFNTALSR